MLKYSASASFLCRRSANGIDSAHHFWGKISTVLLLTPPREMRAGTLLRAWQHLALGGSARPRGAAGPSPVLNALSGQQILKEMGEREVPGTQ